MKIKKMFADNFKSMNNFEMTFGDYVIVIGNNSAGKTTVLQALDFLRFACTSTIEDYLECHSFRPNDLFSKFQSKKTIRFRVEFVDNGSIINWEIAFTGNNKDNFTLNSEKIYSDDSVYLESSSRNTFVLNENTGEKKDFSGISFRSSVMYSLNDKLISNCTAAKKIKNFFENSEFLDLISPYDMRKANREVSDGIGQKGANLSGFLKKLSDEQKNLLINDIKKFSLPLNSLKIVNTGKGWFRLSTEEVYKDKNYDIVNSQVSDGVLRLIAMLSLKYVNSLRNDGGGILAVDEIEDGINTENLEMLYDVFKELSENGIQVVITTHSTVFIDYAVPDELWYAARDTNGWLVIESFRRIKHIMEKLDDLYPGEAVLSTSDSEIRRSLLDYRELINKQESAV